MNDNDIFTVKEFAQMILGVVELTEKSCGKIELDEACNDLCGDMGTPIYLLLNSSRDVTVDWAEGKANCLGNLHANV